MLVLFPALPAALCGFGWIIELNNGNAEVQEKLLDGRWILPSAEQPNPIYGSPWNSKGNFTLMGQPLQGEELADAPDYSHQANFDLTILWKNV